MLRSVLDRDRRINGSIIALGMEKQIQHINRRHCVLEVIEHAVDWRSVALVLEDDAFRISMDEVLDYFFACDEFAGKVNWNHPLISTVLLIQTFWIKPNKCFNNVKGWFAA